MNASADTLVSFHLAAFAILMLRRFADLAVQSVYPSFITLGRGKVVEVRFHTKRYITNKLIHNCD
jgi:hypothetical protein